MTKTTTKEVIMNNTNKMKCPMCEEGIMEYKNIKGLHTYSCEVCPFQGIEGIDYTIEDLIENTLKGGNAVRKDYLDLFAEEVTQEVFNNLVNSIDEENNKEFSGYFIQDIAEDFDEIVDDYDEYVYFENDLLCLRKW